jgi:hypothetical protein
MTAGRVNVAAGELMVWVTSQTEFVDHSVLGDDQSIGKVAGAVYEALCGAEVVAAPFGAIPLPLCDRCVMYRRLRAGMASPRQRIAADASSRHGRRGRWAHLLRRCGWSR